MKKGTQNSHQGEQNLNSIKKKKPSKNKEKVAKKTPAEKKKHCPLWQKEATDCTI